MTQQEKTEVLAALDEMAAAQNMIKVVIVEPGKEPEIRRIANTLEAKQQIVGGLIEIAFRVSRGDGMSLDVICNEEGSILELDPSIMLPAGDDVMPICGPVIFAKANDRTGEFESMTEDEAKLALSIARSCAVALKFVVVVLS